MLSLKTFLKKVLTFVVRATGLDCPSSAYSSIEGWIVVSYAVFQTGWRC